MIRFAKYTEWVYVIIAVLAAYETFSQWNIDRSRAYLFLFFTAVSVGVFFFRRHFRRKFEKRNQP
ncbi:hypothetical protein [uncultured Dokdonia sp.]|uniref:hypothetical protein n=1 Tax=uncultured Dokdonia sp. TaxID=575653 RepID=UPI00263310EA|nr:hypothetical protein [uncultured Dokdonia sp.]